MRCGARFAQDKMQCPSCRKWNPPNYGSDLKNDGTILLSDVSASTVVRYRTGPWDKVFDPGIATASLTLVSGAPGCGKSTMALQIVDSIAKQLSKEAMVVATEQSVGEIRYRTQQIGLQVPNLIRMVPIKDGFEGDLAPVFVGRKPCAILVDSLSGMAPEDPAGQVEFCKRAKDYCLQLNAPMILITHINKEGDMSGLMALQHEVDVLLMMYRYAETSPQRALRCQKNRLGAEESTCLLLTETGLHGCPGCEFCLDPETYQALQVLVDEDGEEDEENEDEEDEES